MADNIDGQTGPILKAERQFSASAMKHFRGTLDSILRSPSIRNVERLRCQIASVRDRVTLEMAMASWEERGKPLWDDWYDWFVAEGLAEPKKRDQ